jgi:flagellar biosynthesis/type III secretory pathway M-ring protein FliF/YscJ
MEVIFVLLVLGIVVWLVTAPFRRRAAAADPELEGERAELEAAKEAKYRQIREADHDHRVGKLTDEDWRTLDAQLRAEAIELLRRLDALPGS